MPKYRVDVCRIAYANRTIEVEAKNPKQAQRLAEDEAGGLDFSEHTSKYEAQTCVKIEDDEHLKALRNQPGSVEEFNQGGFRSFS
jgi:hypothetical protein